RRVRWCGARAWDFPFCAASMSPPVAATGSPRRNLDGQIAFPARDVDPRHRDLHGVAEAESPAGAAPREAEACGIQPEAAVQIQAEPDESFHWNVLQLDEESLRKQPGDDTRTLFAESPLEKAEPLDLDGLALGVGRAPLRAGARLGQPGEGVGIPGRALAA